MWADFYPIRTLSDPLPSLMPILVVHLVLRFVQCFKEDLCALRAAPIMTYELALTILFHILKEEREKLALNQELVLYIYFKITWGCHAVLNVL